MLLSLVIPTYNRSAELRHSLDILRQQIKPEFADQVEIVVCDDASTDDTEFVMTALQQQDALVRYIRYPENIGLERNLIECGNNAHGEYLWIFGDDDFLATNDALETVIKELSTGLSDLIILNRTRQSFALDKVLSDDWMGIKGKPNKKYENVRSFFLDHGFISVIGFITVNIMRREKFLAAYDERYFGTMYPQLGMMADAFSDSQVLLMTEPLICHRTQTASEKAAAFAGKAKEKDFMSDVDLRNATYFGAPYIRMLSALVEKDSLSFREIDAIQENTVINGRLVDFLFNNIVKAVNYGLDISISDQKVIDRFFSNVELSSTQIKQLSRYSFMFGSRFLSAAADQDGPSISVVTPSFNQAKFFPECLDSVFNQSYAPIEHIVLDPGSTDGSRNIARYYRHVTLIEESDEGQGDAVGKGISVAKGDIIAWLNSDDSYYDSHVFQTIARLFSEGDDQVIYGDGIFLDGQGRKIRDVYVNKDPSTLPWRFQQECGIFQPALFFRKSVPEKIGLPSKYLEYCMDYEYWIRAVSQGIQFRYVEKLFAKAYFHTDNKTLGQRSNSYEQVCEMLFDHFGYVNHIWLERYAEFLSEGLDGVIAHRGNTVIENETKYETTYIDLLKRFNLNAISLEKLVGNATKKGFGDTYRELSSKSLLPDHYYEVGAIEENDGTRANYAMGGKIWSFDRKWKERQIQKSHDFLRDKIATRQNDTCVIICNGPSLNAVDPLLLRNFDVIACNAIFLNEEIDAQVDFYTCVNYLVAEQYAPKINKLNVPKVLPWWLAYCINESENTFFVDAKGFSEFSTDIFKNMSWRHTVTFFNMHLAYGLGYQKALIVGCDHSYVQSVTAQEEDVLLSHEDDENHFDPRYFKAKKWQAADTEQMEAMYQLAKNAFEADGREIVNCTDGGELELFRRSSLEEELSTVRHTKISLIGRELLLGHFDRSRHFHFDETHVVAECFKLQGNTLGFMIDVGAHHGWASQPFVDMGWNVLGFEPDPNNRSVLEGRLGDRNNMTVVPKACSERSGETVSFFASNESTGVSGLSAFTDSHKKICDVETTTLADEILAREINEIDFLKIDTEGFDLMVLKGFPWKTHRPKVIECEFENLKTVPLGYVFEDIANYLFDMGYTVYVSEWHPVIRYGVKHDWRALKRYPAKLTEDRSWGNLLAFDSPPDEKELISLVSLLEENIRIEPQEIELDKIANGSSTVGHQSRRFSIERLAERVAAALHPDSILYRTLSRPWRWYLARTRG